MQLEVTTCAEPAILRPPPPLPRLRAAPGATPARLHPRPHRAPDRPGLAGRRHGVRQEAVSDPRTRAPGQAARAGPQDWRELPGGHRRTAGRPRARPEATTTGSTPPASTA